MKLSLFALLLSTAIPLAPFSHVAHASGETAPTAEAGFVLTATTDRPDALYQTGEQATFLLELKRDGKPVDAESVTVTLSKDGVAPQSPTTLTFENGKATVSGTLTEPGFLLVTARKDKIVTHAAAGFDPLQIKPSMPVPEDFDAFWNSQKAKLAEVALRPVLTPVPTTFTGLDFFDVQIPCVGPPVSGYYSRPAGAKPKSLPAILHLHGAGVGSARPGSASWSLQEQGMLSLDINAHGLPNGQPEEFYSELYKTELKGYQHFGRDSRESSYFTGMFLRVARAIEFLAAQPEWDGKTLILFGTSQGAFQAFAGAALDPRVTFVSAGVPAGCDHTGFTVGRTNGWPAFAADSKGQAGTFDPGIAQESRYFDVVNFATHTHARGIAVTVGFIDRTCPPTSVYAAYNAIPVSKKLHADPLVGHTNSPQAMEFLRNAVLEHVRAMRSQKSQ